MGIHGRDRELDRLDSLLVGARAGRGGTLALHAGPGLGRTALLRWAARRAAGFRVLSVRGVPAESELAYAALGRMLPDPPAAPSALHERLAGAALARPVLCVADDADSLDPESLAALAYSARRAGGLPLVVLFGSADELPELPGLALPPLDVPASRRVLADHASPLPEPLAAAVAALACGVPRALVELAADLTPGQRAGAEPPPVALPEHSLLRAFYRSRLQRLTPDARLLLTLAVIDDRLTPPLLAKAASLRDLDLAQLEHPRALGLLRVTPDRVSVPSPLIRGILTVESSLSDRLTAHTLLAAVLDHSAHRLRRLCHQAAATLATAPSLQQAPAGSPPPLVGEIRSASAGTADAGEAADGWAWAAALSGDPWDLLAAAGRAWEAGLADRARSLALRAAEADGGARGRAEALLGEMELRCGLPVKAADLLERAAGAVPADERLGTLALAGEARCLAGDVRGYLALADRAATLPGDGLFALHFAGHAAAYRNARFGGDLRQVVARSAGAPLWGCLAASVLGADEDGRRLALSVRTGVDRPAALHQLALTELWLGRFAESAAASVEGAAAARAAGQVNVEAEHLALLALLAALRGDRSSVELRAAAAAPVLAGHGLSRPEAYLAWARAALDLVEDRPAEAVARLRTVTVHPVIRVATTPLLVEAAAHSRGQRAAGRALALYEAWARSTGSPLRLALAARCRALMAGRDAERHFQDALELHHDVSPFELARTEYLYGAWLRRDRRPSDARDHLRHAVHLFQHYEAVPWAERARAELRAAGESGAWPTLPPTGGLTAQQEQIARLAAEGATNREIAARLVLSHRTVEHHLRNVFARLGVRSRVELARHFR